MRDIHCHILPGVDDGARDVHESLRMLEAAKKAGVTSLVCTPHCRDPYFDYEAMWQAFFEFRDAAHGFPVSMGFEVNVAKLRQLGMEWAPLLGCGMQEPARPGATCEGRIFLLELEVSASPRDFEEDYERVIFELQGLGYRVVIAHPERYRAVQRDVGIAKRLVDLGCRLQASADFVAGGRLGKERGPAKRLFEDNLYSYIASDAHRVEHYAYLAKAREKYRTRGIHMR